MDANTIVETDEADKRELGWNNRVIKTAVRTVDRTEVARTVEKKIEVRDLSAYYGAFRALAEIQLDAYSNKITAIIGPSGCGKSTLLRSLNHMNDLTPNARVEALFSWTKKGGAGRKS